MDDAMRPRRTVLVTGGSDGIGLAAAIRFARAGHRVAIAGRGEERLEAARRTVGGDCAAVRLDVGDPASIDAAVARLADDGLGIDVLVNNAAVMGNATPVGPDLEGELRRSLEANVLAALRLAVLLLPDMARRGFGRIVNVASTSGLTNPPLQIPYAASKAALLAVTRGLALEAAPLGVTVNAVAPGAVATATYLRTKGPAGVAARARSIPRGRLADPDDVAAAIVFLAGEDAGHVNGHTLTVDGGESAAGLYATFVARGREGGG